MSQATAGTGVADERDRLTRRVLAAIRAESAGSSATAADWDALALEVFAFQFDAMPAFGRWCETRGIVPGQVRTTWLIPAVPTEAFKHLPLFAGDLAHVTRTFRTSGTSGPEARGAAHFSPAGLELMDAAIDVRARQMLFPDLDRTRIVVLAPSPEADPERIMAHGIRRLVSTFGSDGGTFLVGPAGLEVDRAVATLREATHARQPITLAGASAALAAVIASLADSGQDVSLPPGSRVMHAGGQKRGAARVDPSRLREQVARWLGVPAARCVNLLGMTELASQLYDDAIRAAAAGEPARRGKVPPPWCRTWATDPASSDPLPPGAVGLLRHLDLANVERPVCVQTDDLGLTYDDGSFEILGRASGAEARGCALDLDEWRSVAAP